MSALTQSKQNEDSHSDTYGDTMKIEHDHKGPELREVHGAALKARSLRPSSWFLVVFALLSALFLFALDNTIVADVQANIIYTLGGIEKLPWISVAFALGAISTNLFWSVTMGGRRHIRKPY